MIARALFFFLRFRLPEETERVERKPCFLFCSCFSSPRFRPPPCFPFFFRCRCETHSSDLALRTQETSKQNKTWQGRLRFDAWGICTPFIFPATWQGEVLLLFSCFVVGARLSWPFQGRLAGVGGKKPRVGPKKRWRRDPFPFMKTLLSFFLGTVLARASFFKPVIQFPILVVVSFHLDDLKFSEAAERERKNRSDEERGGRKDGSLERGR